MKLPKFRYVALAGACAGLLIPVASLIYIRLVAGAGSLWIVVDHLIGMALGGSDTFNAFNGESFNRSMNNFGSLPTAVFGHNGTRTSVDLGSGSLYSYLWAHYGGPGGGTVKVWYVGDLNGTITIPASDGHGLSGWTLFAQVDKGSRTVAPQSCCWVRRLVRSAWPGAS